MVRGNSPQRLLTMTLKNTKFISGLICLLHILRTICQIAFAMKHFLIFEILLFNLGFTHVKGLITTNANSRGANLFILQMGFDKVNTEAEMLLEKARKIRESIPILDKTPIESASTSKEDPQLTGIGYRLYVDIGREDGTWMDPRWGASGNRIEFTLDVNFDNYTPAPPEVANKIVKDNFGGMSSKIMLLNTGANARLRGGFDTMGTFGGAYRIDSNGKDSTVRFFVEVEGKSGPSYGDINIPLGCLYFSLPCFGGRTNQLSRKDGPVTVRQIGWHTGWRREESRIIGIVRALPLDEAQKRDKY